MVGDAPSTVHQPSGSVCEDFVPELFPMQTQPSAKKYDRQLRIWGAHGQKALETFRICVFGSGCTATEALKNLVLGGIAGFTVVDDAVVDASDLGNNYLLGSQDIGRHRASAVTQLLLELNENVAGSYVEESPLDLLASSPRFISEFQLVLASQASVGLEATVDSPFRWLCCHLAASASVL